MKLAFFFRKYHKWLALIVGVQALLWCLSGLYMTAIHIDFIHGDHLVKPETHRHLNDHPIKALPQSIVDELGTVKSIELVDTATGINYLVQTEQQLIRFDALSLQRLPTIDEAKIRSIAHDIYAGDHQIQSVDLLTNYQRELGGREQPVWRVQYDDWLTSTLYFLPDTGQLRSKRTDLWRWYDFLWMLHIMDYQTREEVNNNLLRIAASIGLLLTLSGVGLLFYSFKNQPTRNASFVGVVKKIHKWVALFLGVQLVLWTLSGLMFSLLPGDKVSGRYLLNHSAPVSWHGNVEDLSRLANRYEQVTRIESSQLLDQSVYRVTLNDKIATVNATDLLPIDINKTLAEAIVLDHYAGDGKLEFLNKENTKTIENRQFKLPVWHASFSDAENSSLYISAETGQVYGVKTDTWRLYDFFWMLHIMDYSEREDINNALVIFAVSSISFIALSGIWLIFTVFSLRDFNLFARFKRAPVVINNEQGFNSEIFARKNDNLYQVLSSAGFDLPSNCGGGGSCGLCRVKVDAGSHISEADKNLISAEDLNSGFRLACQLNVQQGIEVLLPDQVLQQQVYSCRVISNQFKTPLIKELVLAMPESADFEFQSGEYVLLHIPSGETRLSDIEVDEKYRVFWEKNNINHYFSQRSESFTRAYSMANPPIEKDKLVFNIRLALPSDKNAESGRASSYLFAAKPGDEIKVSGAFGHFHIRSSKNQMVFIGGGAGMAPLRSHILHQLETRHNPQKISFWFGARNTQEIFYQQEFEQLVKKYPNFCWHVGLSELQPDEEWNGFRGMIHELVEQAFFSEPKNLAQVDFYVCGPSVMNRAVVGMLRNHGVDMAHISIDEF